MIYKNHILIASMLFTQIISTSKPDHVVIEIDDDKTIQQAKLLEEKRNIMRYVKQQQNQQWAKYEEITDCCCLTAFCVPSVAHLMEPCITTIPEVSLFSIFSAGACMLAIDRYAQSNCLPQQQRVKEIDKALKEKFD